MAEVVLKANTRMVTGKQVKALRREGRLPAVIYGKGISPLAIDLDFREVSRVLFGLSSSLLVIVEVDGKPHTTLVRERQRHPVTGALQHIDFLEVSLTEKLRTSVEIELIGVSPIVKEADAILVSMLESLDVESLPGDLPEKIMVDISSLTEFGQAIHVAEIPRIPKVEFLNDPDEIIVVATTPAVEEEIEAGEVEEAEPEVVERGKKEEEEY